MSEYLHPSINDNTLVEILKDRLEVITADSFTTNDKVKISSKFLIPQLEKEYALQTNYSISDENIRFIVNKCEKEKGVRNLKRALDQLFRKLNMLQYYNDGLSYDMETNTPVITKEMICKLLPKKKENDILLRMYL